MIVLDTEERLVAMTALHSSGLSAKLAQSGLGEATRLAMLDTALDAGVKLRAQLEGAIEMSQIELGVLFDAVREYREISGEPTTTEELLRDEAAASVMEKARGALRVKPTKGVLL